MKESVPTPGPVRVNFILGDKTVFSKMWQLFTYFETDSLGSCKILSEYRFSSEFCQVQVVFEFFEIKNKKKNKKIAKYAKAVCDWVVEHLQISLKW